MRQRWGIAAVACTAIASFAGCSGGGGTAAPAVGIVAPVPTATPIPAPQGFAVSDAVAIPAPVAGAATVPVAFSADVSGASASAALPAEAVVPVDTTIDASYSSSLDTALPPLSAGRQITSLSPSAETKIAALAFLRLRFSADVSLPKAPAFTLVIPGTLPATASYWLAFYDPLRAAAGWQYGFEGPATVTAVTVKGKPATELAFASNGQPLTFVAHQSYGFAVVSLAAGAPSPTPVPSSVPTNPPPVAKPARVVATPASIAFADVTSAPVVLTFAQANYTGAFALHGDCTGIVNTTGTSPAWTISPVGKGRCAIVGLGDRGAAAVVHIAVAVPLETPHPISSPSPSPSRSPEPVRPPSPSPSPASH